MFLETICIKSGKAVNIDGHIKRMKKTASYFGFEPPNIPDIEKLITPGMNRARLKCSIAYHTKINSISFERYQVRSIHSLKLIDATPDYAYKFSNRNALNNLLSLREGCDDILIVRNGCITDTSFSNVVFARGDELYTPRYPLLNGTKRQLLIEEGKIKEVDVTPDSINEYERVYLINAMLDVEDDVFIPVGQIM